MQKRAEALHDTRNRIVWATMQLHGEKGIFGTTLTDIAARAGVGPATVYRHFQTMGSLIRACGDLTWIAVSPPKLDEADRLYAGLDTARARLHRYVEEVSEFYGRAWGPLESARRDRSRIPELDEDLRWIEAGLEGLIRKALAPEHTDEHWVQLVRALTDFGVWKSLRNHGLTQAEAPKIISAVLECAELHISRAARRSRRSP